MPAFNNQTSGIQHRTWYCFSYNSKRKSLILTAHKFDWLFGVTDKVQPRFWIKRHRTLATCNWLSEIHLSCPCTYFENSFIAIFEYDNLLARRRFPDRPSGPDISPLGLRFDRRSFEDLFCCLEQFEWSNFALSISPFISSTHREVRNWLHLLKAVFSYNIQHSSILTCLSYWKLKAQNHGILISQKVPNKLQQPGFDKCMLIRRNGIISIALFSGWLLTVTFLASKFCHHLGWNFEDCRTSDSAQYSSIFWPLSWKQGGRCTFKMVLRISIALRIVKVTIQLSGENQQHQSSSASRRRTWSQRQFLLGGRPRGNILPYIKIAIWAPWGSIWSLFGVGQGHVPKGIHEFPICHFNANPGWIELEIVCLASIQTCKGVR